MVPWLAVTHSRAKCISGSLYPRTQLGHLQTVAAVIAATCLEFISSSHSQKCVFRFLPELWYPCLGLGVLPTHKMGFSDPLSLYSHHLLSAMQTGILNIWLSLARLLG